MSSFLNAFVLLFYVVENLFCGEAGCHLPERRRLHFQVLLRGGGRVERGAASPLRRLRRGAEQRVEIDSPFQGGSTGHGAGNVGWVGIGSKRAGGPPLRFSSGSRRAPRFRRASERGTGRLFLFVKLWLCSRRPVSIRSPPRKGSSAALRGDRAEPVAPSNRGDVDGLPRVVAAAAADYICLYNLSLSLPPLTP